MTSMLRRSTQLLAFTLATAVSHAQWSLHQTQPILFLQDAAPNPCLNQEMPDLPIFSSFVAEDVRMNTNVIQTIRVGLRFTNPATLANLQARVQGWKIAIATSKVALELGNGFYTVVNPPINVTIVPQVPDSAVVELPGVNIAVNPGSVLWIACYPILNSTLYGNTYILKQGMVTSNTSKLSAYFFNPGNGFGQGLSQPSNINAAISIGP